MKNLLLVLFFILSSLVFSQQTEYVDFKKIKADIGFDVSQNKIYGKFTCTFEILKNTDSIYLDAVNMRLMKIRMIPKNANSDIISRGEVISDYDYKKIYLKYSFLKGQEYKLSFFFFKNNPKKALYFVEKDEKPQIWTQGQGKYTSNWLPSIDDMNDKIEFDLSITFDKSYEVIANGQLKDKKTNDSTTTWHYDMKEPMSSYLVALAIGKYNKKVEYSKSGIPLEMYYYPEDSLKVEPTYRYTKQMFDFLEEEIGVLYPWQNYKQVPVKDFLYAGMENTGTTIFADSFVIDSIAFVDKNFVNVNAHELAHQWFGNLVTETSGTHHWLQEGFATYYALLAERDIFGDDYYYWRLYEYAQELLAQDEAGGSTSLLDPKSSSTTFYKKGAWVLHILREQVGGESFRKSVKNYLKKHQFKNVVTADFIREVEKASGEDLNEFVNIWLDLEKLPIDFIDFNLVLTDDKFSETSIFSYLGGFEYSPTQVELLRSSQSKKFDLNSVLPIFNLFSDELVKINSPISDKILIEYLGRLKNIEVKDMIILYKRPFATNNTKVRQAIAQTLNEIPSELKEDYETLLNDKSYITIETALFNLWSNFPEDRKKYLNKTKSVIGFNDKNVKILWLALALITEDFETENKKHYFDELTNYTSSKFGFEIRQNAFQYLNQIQACNAICKENLKQATMHHNWRFSKFAKTTLEVLAK